MAAAAAAAFGFGFGPSHQLPLAAQAASPLGAEGFAAIEHDAELSTLGFVSPSS